MTDVDVLIVGGGPSGATLSLLLAQAGVTSHIIEREKSHYPLPRAVHFDGQIMRVFQTIGIADALDKVVRFNPGMRFIDPDGNLLLDWPRPTELGEDGWQTSYRFHQPDLESILRTSIKENPYSHLTTSAEVIAVSQTEHYVDTDYRLEGDQTTQNIRAKYVVGCDGARSTIRQVINRDSDSDMEDLGFHEQWLVIDALLSSPKAALGDFTIQYCGAERPATYVRGPGNRRRWEISLKPEDSVDNFKDLDACWRLLSHWISPSEASIERSAVYEFNSKIARQWRDRRLLIAGDAAHLTPPFMGQGMCAGIRDVSNLAWKLAYSCQQPDDSLLDSYQSERAPHVREYITTAITLGAVINSCSTQDALHEAFSQEDGTVQMKSLNPRLGPGLGLELETRLKLHRGLWFPQIKLNSGQWLDDLTGYKPAIITTASLMQSCQQLVTDHALDWTVISTHAEPHLKRMLSTFATQSILLRPDRYILGSADDVEELELLVQCLSSGMSK